MVTLLPVELLFVGEGAALVWAVLRGELTQRHVWQYRFKDPSGSISSLADSPALLAEWLAAHYGTQVLLLPRGSFYVSIRL